MTEKQELPQLRVRTEFSFRQCFGPVGRVAAALAELGAPAAGIVDDGTWGHVRWGKAAAKSSFRPLFGRELSFPLPDGRKPKAWVLAADTKAFYRFSTAAQREGADLHELIASAPGLVRFAGAALTDPAHFDYIDLNPASRVQQLASLRLAKATGKPLVVTSDNWYPAPADAAAFLAIGGREALTAQHLLREHELREALRILDDEAWAAAVRNTHEAAERCASELPTAPIISVPGDLRELVLAGKAERLALGHIAEWTAEYEARMERELAMIASKQFESYFIVVSDLVRWAKTKMLVGPARGSSAGSLVCFLLRITEVDPLIHDLLFERFIDVTRKDLPDIDIDFADTKRDMVFDYLAEKYGRECVARIGNVMTLKSKSAINEVCKRFGVPDRDKFDVVDSLIEYTSGDSRYGKGLEDTLTTTAAGKRFLEKHPKAAIMSVVEGHAWHTGVHAAGVIVCNVPVSDYCTIAADGVAQIDKPDSEALNLLKIDALGLRTLGVMEDAGVATADQLYSLPLNDPAVFEVFNDRKYSGIFQFEGQAQRGVSAEVHIDSFKKIDHVTALARPGPLGAGASSHYIERAAGREEIEYRHPSMAAYLSDTMGVVLYQEQVMRIAFEVGKFDWATVSAVRKAMSGRKGKEYFDNLGNNFASGAAEVGMDEATAKRLWTDLANYGAWCVSGDTILELPTANQHTPRRAAIRDLVGKTPRLWCVQEDGTARPTRAVRIFKSGTKETLLLKTQAGESIRLTADHEVLTDAGFVRAGELAIGQKIALLGERLQNPHRTKKQTGAGLGPGRYERKGIPRGPYGKKLSPAKAFEQVRSALVEKHPFCRVCGAPWEEEHHIDFDRSNNAPENVELLCRTHHKLIHQADPRTKAFSHKNGRGVAFSELTFIGEPRMEGVFDVEMPAPNHNFLANGVFVHNCMNKSHTVSYGIISYWCAWFKRYHPLEYAAACLRNAKDDTQTMEILREVAAEGIDYTPFDVEASEVNWSVKGGRLIGGFLNLEGFGMAKASAAVEARNNGTMDDKLRAKIAAAPVKFSDLYPLRTAYREYYDDPESKGCRAGSRILTWDQFPEGGDVLWIAKVLEKKPRDSNEALMIAKRGGKKLSARTAFADFRMADDTGTPIIVRIDRFDFEPMGRRALEELRPGEDVVLIRGRRIPNYSMIKVTRIKCLTRPEVVL